MAKSKYEYVKDFENQVSLLPNTYILVRVDGKGFTKFCDEHEYIKPNDLRGIEVMTLAGMEVCKVYTEIFLAYGQSDEFSFVFRRDAQLYNRRSDKILSCVVSTFTSAFVYYWYVLMPGKMLKFPPTFDARVVLYPSYTNIRDYFSWRYVDCHINNLYNTCFWALVEKGKLTKADAHAKLKGTFSKDKHDILMLDYGINYNNIEEVYKKGTTILRIQKKSDEKKAKEKKKTKKPVESTVEAKELENKKEVEVSAETTECVETKSFNEVERSENETTTAIQKVEDSIQEMSLNTVSVVEAKVSSSKVEAQQESVFFKSFSQYSSKFKQVYVDYEKKSVKVCYENLVEDRFWEENGLNIL